MWVVSGHAKPCLVIKVLTGAPLFRPYGCAACESAGQSSPFSFFLFFLSGILSCALCNGFLPKRDVRVAMAQLVMVFDQDFFHWSHSLFSFGRLSYTSNNIRYRDVIGFLVWSVTF
jgi:hypothetical protein